MSQQTFMSGNTRENLERYQKIEEISMRIDGIQRVLILLERYNGCTFKDNIKFLEIGLGAGDAICQIARNYHWSVAGLEPSPIFLEKVREKNSNYDLKINLQLGAAEDKPFAFAGQQFDIILMQSVLEHVKDYKLALSNVYESLNPGGIFFFNTTNKFCFSQGEYNFPPYLYSYLPNPWRFRIRKWRQGSDIMEHGIDFHQFIPWQLKRELEHVGFRHILNFIDISHEKDFPKNRRFLVSQLKRNSFLSAIYQLFFTGTCFICSK